MHGLKEGRYLTNMYSFYLVLSASKIVVIILFIPANLTFADHVFSSFTYQAITNATVSVDTFFFLRYVKVSTWLKKTVQSMQIKLQQ